MGKLFSNIVAFFTQKSWIYFLLLGGMIALFITGARRLKLDENLYSIFPKGEEFEKFNSILKENNLNKQVLFSIGTEGKSSDEIVAELDSLNSLLEDRLGNYVKDLVYERENDDSRVIDHFYNCFPAYLNESDYELIKQKIQQDSIDDAVHSVYDRMMSMNALFMRKMLAKDPLGLAWNKLQLLQPQVGDSSMTVEDGILYAADHKRALITGVLNFELDNNEKNAEFNEALIGLKEELRTQTSFDFDYFGTFQISYENSRQVKEDTFLTLMISIGLILVLLLFYYRSFLMPIYFVLPAMFAGLAGVGMVGFIHPEISAISLATAAVLMGIVLDYSFHFFTHYAHTGDLLASVKQLSFPMLVGSFTTVAAFAALMFTDSIVLQNFGMIALCTLSSAAIFTLLFLPPLLKFTRFKPRVRDGKEKRPMSKWGMRIALYSILGVTVFSIFKSNNFTFDADLNNLSYHTDELVQSEEYYTGINPKEEKKIHLFVSGATEQEIRQHNFELYKVLLDYRAENGLEELISLAPYQLSDEDIGEASQEWVTFWKDYGARTKYFIDSTSATLDFSSTAFHAFDEWTSSSMDVENTSELVASLGLNNLRFEGNDGTSVATSVVIKRSQLEDFKETIKDLDFVYVFDVAEMTNALMLSVQNDFNYLLLFSSLLVLISLLVIYGRVELALFAFLPMVVSWLWILAIAAIFDIQFNFVNIIVATFIFGLGDDFSIFVTDGLLQHYKTKVNSLTSYRSAIILSGITTIIGTGALYFAKHPAVHSIAVISVVGISCILIVTLVVQPILFKYFITNRTEKGRSPITFIGLISSILFYLYFFVGCVVINGVLLVFLILPLPKSKKRRMLNYLVSKLAKSTLYLGVHVKKKIVNPERMDFSKPSIIIANHTSFLDILLVIMMHPRVIIMVKKWVYNSPFFGFFIRYCGYLFIAEGTESNLSYVKERIEDGYSIVIFPEGTRSKDGEMRRFHKGAFHIAKELKLDIQPMLIVGVEYVNAKNDIMIKSGVVGLVALERIPSTSPIFEQRLGLITKEIQRQMRQSLEHYRGELLKPHELRKRVLLNYLYKGPVLEWYVRIKWRFEINNYAFYDEILGDRNRIYDVGCGYGYLSFLLHYRNKRRLITGIDYDEEKIQVAQNCYDKNENLHFVQGDAAQVQLEQADAVFYNDVLHYMSKEKQLKVLNHTVDQLNDEGLILIRDGITDYRDRHELTKRTEKYSTRLFNFNKVQEELCFFSSEDIFKFAKERNMHCEIVEQSSKTSNVLFLLRKT